MKEQFLVRSTAARVLVKLILVTVLLGSLFMGFYILPARATTTVYASADNCLIVNSEDPSVANTVYSDSDLGVGFNWEVWPFSMPYIGFGSAIKFNIDAEIGGKTIIEATLILWPYLLPTDLNTQYAVNAMAAYWNPATITWNNQPNYYESGEARINPPLTTAIPMEFDVTTIVQNWADGSWTNYGFMLRETTLIHPGDNAWRATGIESLEYWFDYDHRPQLYLEYSIDNYDLGGFVYEKVGQFCSTTVIPGATITLSPGGYSTVSDQSGYYTLSVPDGTYTVTISKPGWQTLYQTVIISGSDVIKDFCIVIPEFPSFLFLPLFMIATLLAVIVYKRKHSMSH